MAELKKIIMIGRSEAGKTTLSNMLINNDSYALKTQSIGRIGSIIDTPGEYLENPRFYSALLLNSYDAEVVILVHEASKKQSLFPPGFASAFNRDVIGVVTKADLGEDIELARNNLKLAGAKKIFEVTSMDMSSIEPLKEYLQKNK